MTPDEERLENARLENALRDALDAEAREVQIAGDGLDRIRRRTAARRPWQRLVPAVAGVAAMGVVAAVVWGSGLIGADKVPVANPPHITTATIPTTTPTTPTTPTSDASKATLGTTPTEPATTMRSLPVYYVGEQFFGADAAPPPTLLLFREYHHLPATDDRADWIAVALNEMFVNTPDDDDYRYGVWPATTRADSTTYDAAAGAITVNLTDTEDIVNAAPPDGVSSSSAAAIALQQVVYTATAAAVADGSGSATTVTVTIDGAPVTELFGTPVTVPAQRSAAVLASIWIDKPAENEAVASPVTVTGVAAVFEAQGEWRVFNDQRMEVANGVFRTTESGKRLPFTLDVGPLPSGQYTIEVFDWGGLGMPGRGPIDTKTFTVY